MGVNIGPDELAGFNNGYCPGGVTKAMRTDKTGDFFHYNGSC